MKQNYDVLLFVHEDPRDFCRLAPWAINSLRLAHFFAPPLPPFHHVKIVLSAASVCVCMCAHWHLQSENLIKLNESAWESCARGLATGQRWKTLADSHSEHFSAIVVAASDVAGLTELAIKKQHQRSSSTSFDERALPACSWHKWRASTKHCVCLTNKSKWKPATKLKSKRKPDPNSHSPALPSLSPVPPLPIGFSQRTQCWRTLRMINLSSMAGSSMLGGMRGKRCFALAAVAFSGR